MNAYPVIHDIQMNASCADDAVSLWKVYSKDNLSWARLP